MSHIVVVWGNSWLFYTHHHQGRVFNQTDRLPKEGANSNATSAVIIISLRSSFVGGEGGLSSSQQTFLVNSHERSAPIVNCFNLKTWAGDTHRGKQTGPFVFWWPHLEEDTRINAIIYRLPGEFTASPIK